MGYKYSLEHLTTLALPPPELVRMAARIGYDAVSLRFIGMRLPNEPDYDPSHQPQLKRELRAARIVAPVPLLHLRRARNVERHIPGERLALQRDLTPLHQIEPQVHTLIDREPRHNPLLMIHMRP